MQLLCLLATGRVPQHPLPILRPIIVHSLIPSSQQGRSLPTWNHIHKSGSSSSRREQAANVAFSAKQLSPQQRLRSVRRAARKSSKQNHLLRDVVIPDKLKSSLLTIEDINNNVVVFDGIKKYSRRCIRPPLNVSSNSNTS